MGNFIDLTGQRFGRWTVIARGSNASDGAARWRCRCDCGKEHIVRGRDLRAGVSKSCGCLQKDNARQLAMKYESCDMRLYRIWCAMRKRCNNPKHQYYYVYGGRGISVCAEWESDFGAFQRWSIANGYSPELTIDRIDNQKGYSPENCRWADAKTQANNHRNNIMLTLDGETLTLAQWSEKIDINYETLLSRYKSGWTVEEILTLRPNPQLKSQKERISPTSEGKPTT